MAYNGRRLLAVVQDEVVDVESGKTVLGNLKYRRLIGFGIGTPALAVGSRENGRWELARLDTNSQPQWTVDIGSQLFEHEIAPICQLRRMECSILAVADAEGSVKLFSENGQALGKLEFSQNLRGLMLVEIDRQAALIVSHGQGLECWQLDPNGQTVSAASATDRIKKKGVRLL